MTPMVEAALGSKLKWQRGMDPEYPYFADFRGVRFVIRVNDFPAQELYSLIIDGKPVKDFNEWPEQWSRP